MANCYFYAHQTLPVCYAMMMHSSLGGLYLVRCSIARASISEANPFGHPEAAPARQ
jgi:hypothetical protein